VSIKGLKIAIEILNKDGVIALNTDTLFALSCDATNTKAVSKVFTLKQRSAEKSLPIFVSSIAQALECATLNEQHLKLARAFWPGPLTILAPIKPNSGIASNISDNNLIALRIPENQMILNIIQQLDKPITGTSANISGHSNIYTVQELTQTFGKDLYIDLCQDIDIKQKTPQPSTIVHINELGECEIIRPGAIDQEKITQLLK
jgi:L-threonylcarbamoyladenylate synthase